MAMLNILYTRKPGTEFPNCRHKTTEELENHLTDLVMELKFADISADLRLAEGEKSELSVNGKTAVQILTELGDDIRTPEVDEEVAKAPITILAKPDREWDGVNVEDLSDLLIKNILSKSFADADKLRIKNVR